MAGRTCPLPGRFARSRPRRRFPLERIVILSEAKNLTVVGTRKVKIHLIAGFLGSGKTTLLRNFLSRPKLSEKVAVLMNEIGEVCIDAPLIRRQGLGFAELTNNCICCLIEGDLVTTIVNALDRFQPERLLVETTGIAEPGKILKVLYQADPLLERTRVEPTVCVVDASAFEDLYDKVAYHYVMQIKAADVILLNKTDRCDTAMLDRVEKRVKELNPRAFLLRTERCRVDLLRLLEGPDAHTGPLDPEAIPTTDHEEYQTFFVPMDSSVETARLRKFLDGLEGLFRAKGFLRTTGRAAPASGPSGRLALVNWTCGGMEWEPWPSPLGPSDREGLVFIGRGLDRSAIQEGLKSCAI